MSRTSLNVGVLATLLGLIFWYASLHKDDPLPGCPDGRCPAPLVDPAPKPKPLPLPKPRPRP